MVRQTRRILPVHRRASYEAEGGVQVLGIPIVDGAGREASVDAALKKVTRYFNPYRPYLSDTGREYVGELTDSQGKPLRQKEDLLARRPTKENPRLEYIQEPFAGMDDGEVMRRIWKGGVLEESAEYLRSGKKTRVTYFLNVHGCPRGCNICATDPDWALFGQKKPTIHRKPFGLHLKLLDYFGRLADRTGERPAFDRVHEEYFCEPTNARDALYEADFADYHIMLVESLNRMFKRDYPVKVSLVSSGWPLSDKIAQLGAQKLVEDKGENLEKFIGTISHYTRKARDDLPGYIAEMRNVFETLQPLRPIAQLVYLERDQARTFELASQILGGQGKMVDDPRESDHPIKQVDCEGSDLVGHARSIVVQPGGRSPEGTREYGDYISYWGMAFMPNGDVSIIGPTKGGGKIYETGINAFVPKT